MKHFTPTLMLIVSGLGAFLLFAVQPIASKHFLPLFGGGASVWSTSLMFFTTLLLFGYFYVYILTKFPSIIQRRIHTIFVFTTIIYILITCINSAPLYALAPLSNTTSPFLSTLFSLLFSVGLPYLLLATTAPLIQYWYSNTTNKDPYMLYALSNTGSLLALIAYPLLFDPLTTNSTQNILWVLGFIIYAIIILIITKMHTNSKKEEKSLTYAGPPQDFGLDDKKLRWSVKRILESCCREHLQGRSPKPRTKQALQYSFEEFHTRQRNTAKIILLSLLPSLLLVSSTTFLTQSVAQIPLLWLAPLLLYILAFIITFSGSTHGATLTPALTYITGGTIIYTAYMHPIHISLAPLILIFMFLGSLLTTRALYNLRPKQPFQYCAAVHTIQDIPYYYLLISLGGALGTILGALIAPLIFTQSYEYLIAIIATITLSIYLLPNIFLTAFPKKWHNSLKIFFITIFIPIVIYIVIFQPFLFANIKSIAHLRNYYGNKHVYNLGLATVLQHGSTIHGMQFNTTKERYAPTTYYKQDSGAAQAILFSRPANTPAHIGIIGLGVGALSTYCEPKDSFIFYEIDPQIITIAKKYFSFLNHCKGSYIIEGDARQNLAHQYNPSAKRNPPRFDTLIVDAFTDDAIPTHLLTKEAFAIYKNTIKQNTGTIAVHISNRHFDLLPSVIGTANTLGFFAQHIRNDDSNWVILALNPKILTSPLTKEETTKQIIWTDNYTNLMKQSTLYLFLKSLI